MSSYLNIYGRLRSDLYTVTRLKDKANTKNKKTKKLITKIMSTPLKTNKFYHEL